jgi:hypothetical protein
LTLPSIVTPGHTKGGQASNATTITITTPLHSAGDRIYVTIVNDEQTPNLQPPDGTWTALKQNAAIQTSAAMSVFYKTAGGSEPATYVFTQNLERSTYIAWAVTNDGGVNVQAGIVSTGTGTSAPIVTLTTTVNDCLHMAAVGTDISAGGTLPMTAGRLTKLDEQSTASGGALGIFYENRPTLGVIPADTVTIAISEQWGAFNWADRSQEIKAIVAPKKRIWRGHR